MNMEYYTQYNTLTPALWDEYSVNAFRTTPDAGQLAIQWGIVPPDTDPCMVVWDMRRMGDVFDLQHGALGLATELYELACAKDEENRIEELGDLCWYLAVIVRGLRLAGFNVVPFEGEAVHGTTFPHCAHEIISDVKRLAYYDRQTVCARLSGNIRSTLLAMEQAAHPLTMAELLSQNSHKLLKKRYPNGFSNEAATTRLDKPGESD